MTFIIDCIIDTGIQIQKSKIYLNEVALRIECTIMP